MVQSLVLEFRDSLVNEALFFSFSLLLSQEQAFGKAKLGDPAAQEPCSPGAGVMPVVPREGIPHLYPQSRVQDGQTRTLELFSTPGGLMDVMLLPGPICKLGFSGKFIPEPPRGSLMP